MTKTQNPTPTTENVRSAAYIYADAVAATLGYIGSAGYTVAGLRQLQTQQDSALDALLLITQGIG